MYEISWAPSPLEPRAQKDTIVQTQNPNKEGRNMANVRNLSIAVAIAAIAFTNACSSANGVGEPVKGFVNIHGSCGVVANAADAGTDTGGDVPPGDMLQATTQEAFSATLIQLALNRGIKDDGSADIVTTSARGGNLSKTGVCQITFEEGEELGDELLHADNYDIKVIGTPDGFDIHGLGGVDAPSHLQIGRSADSSVDLCLAESNTGAGNRVIETVTEELPPAIHEFETHGNVCVIFHSADPEVALHCSKFQINGGDGSITTDGTDISSSPEGRPSFCPDDALWLAGWESGIWTFSAECDGGLKGAAKKEVPGSNETLTHRIRLYDQVADGLCMLAEGGYSFGDNTSSWDFAAELGRGTDGSCVVMNDDELAKATLTLGNDLPKDVLSVDPNSPLRVVSDADARHALTSVETGTLTIKVGGDSIKVTVAIVPGDNISVSETPMNP